MAPETVAVPSDPGLPAEVRRFGTFDPGGCYQCGTCVLSCEMAGDFPGLPRRDVRYARLGLREPLLGSLTPWLCHDCGDCSRLCPHDAEPRASMATLRRYLHAQYDWTGLSSRILRSRAWHFGSLGGAALLTLAVILLYHFLHGRLGWKDLATPMGLEHALPLMAQFTQVVVLLPVVLLLTQAARMWRAARRGGEAIPVSAYVAEAHRYVVNSIGQPLMRRCRDRSRWPAHLLLASGVFTMLVIKVFALRWFQTDRIVPFTDPQRWVGYLATAFIVYGVADLVVEAMRERRDSWRERRSGDFAFPVLLLATALTGIGAHIFRYAGLALAAHLMFAAHVVVTTPLLVVEIPFGNWSHMIFRPLAVYLDAVGRRARGAGGAAMPEPALIPPAPPKEVIDPAA